MNTSHWWIARSFEIAVDRRWHRLTSAIWPLRHRRQSEYSQSSLTLLAYAEPWTRQLCARRNWHLHYVSHICWPHPIWDGIPCFPIWTFASAACYCKTDLPLWFGCLDCLHTAWSVPSNDRPRRMPCTSVNFVQWICQWLPI